MSIHVEAVYVHVGAMIHLWKVLTKPLFLLHNDFGSWFHTVLLATW
jgi:hypothetical protein